jgi:hypothetical protein
MRFGNDWTGLFLRGDAALPYAMYLSQFIEGAEKRLGSEQSTDVIGLMMLRGLASLLGSCDDRGPAPGWQNMRSIEECLISVEPGPTSEGESSPTG